MKDIKPARVSSAFLRASEIVSIVDIADNINLIRMKDGMTYVCTGTAGQNWEYFISVSPTSDGDPDPFVEVGLAYGTFKHHP